jgi:large subunit ribosomal protein L46
MSAVCLERPPVITQERNEQELEFARLRVTREVEQSCLSDHELRHREDLTLAAKKQQEGYEDTGDQVRTTALEWEDACEEELKAFKPASRKTEADLSKDVRSLERRLDRRLILLVKQQLGDKPLWVLPMQRRLEGESMRGAAERAVASLCGPHLCATFLGNAPCGYYAYRYPPPMQTSSGCSGAKVFFFKAQHRSGQVALSDKDKTVSDFMWVSADDLNQYLVPTYARRVKKFLLDL